MSVPVVFRLPAVEVSTLVRSLGGSRPPQDDIALYDDIALGSLPA